MKKAALLVGIVLTMALAFSACKTHERCPAYGQAGTELPVSDKV